MADAKLSCGCVKGKYGPRDLCPVARRLRQEFEILQAAAAGPAPYVSQVTAWAKVNAAWAKYGQHFGKQEATR